MASLAERAYRKITRTMFGLPVDRIRSFDEIGPKFERINFRSPSDNIPGWMTWKEQKLLYILGAYSKGDVLEIGPWLGRSTACIAKGVKESKTKKRFVTCELAPTMEFYREMPDGRVGFFYPADSEVPLGSMPRDKFDKEKRPWLEHPEGFVYHLKNNLQAAGVKELVEIFIGNFWDSPVHPYGLVFADVTHTPAEVELHAEHLRKRLAPGGVLACHDTSKENAACLRRLFNFQAEFQADSLFAGELA
jgi:predicted O-methyltransferase YrrM